MAVSLIASVSSLVYGCGNVTSEHEAPDNPSGYTIFQSTSFVDSSILKSAIAKYRDYKNKYIANDLFANMVVDVPQLEINSYKNNDQIKGNTKEFIVKLLSSNFYMYHIIKYGVLLNASDFSIRFDQKISEKEAGYFGTNYKDYYRVIIYDNNDKNVSQQLIVRFKDFDYQMIDQLDVQSWKLLVDETIGARNGTTDYGDTFIYQNAFMFLTFNGKKSNDNDKKWEEDQTVSIKEIVNENVIYLSYRQEAAGLIPKNSILNSKVIKVDPLKSLVVGNTEGNEKIHISPTNPDQLIFDQAGDFGLHSIVMKCFFNIAEDPDNALETWGSYLQDTQIY